MCLGFLIAISPQSLENILSLNSSTQALVAHTLSKGSASVTVFIILFKLKDI